MGFNRVPQWPVRQDSIAILSPNFLPFEESVGFEIGDDALYGAFGNADLRGHAP